MRLGFLLFLRDEMAFEVDNLFRQEFSDLIYEFLHQRGSTLLPYVTMEPFIAGASRWILMQGVGDAISESELVTDRPVYTDIRADARLLEPHG
jgi:hypothetical protein